MSDNVTRIKEELESLGRPTELLDSPRGQVVAFSYKVEVGRHKGERFMLGVSMQGKEQYPEYPPHWLHISPPVDDGKGGAAERYRGADGQEWIVMSRPPGTIWDRLQTKSMDAYLKENVRRFWNNA